MKNMVVICKTTLVGIPYGIYPNMCSKYMYIYFLLLQIAV